VRLAAQLVAALVAGLVAGALAAGPAAAHNSLRSTSPTADGQVERTPAAVVLTFDEPAIALGTRIVVTGASGPVQVGEPRLVDNTVTQTLQPGAPAGRYVVEWRVTSADGHPISGTFSFTAAAPGTGEPVPVPEPAGPAASAGPAVGPGWVPVVVAAILVLVLGLLGYRFRWSRSARASRYDHSAPSAGETRPTRTESRPPSDE
jgi:copper resistance protein C